MTYFAQQFIDGLALACTLLAIATAIVCASARVWQHVALVRLRSSSERDREQCQFNFDGYVKDTNILVHLLFGEYVVGTLIDAIGSDRCGNALLLTMMVIVALFFFFDDLERRRSA